MHVISRKRIQDAKKQFSYAASALDGWYKIVAKNDFTSHAALKKTFNSVDKVGHYHVFNVGGNKLRIIAVLHFNRNKIYIRHVLTHKAYDKGDWKC